MQRKSSTYIVISQSCYTSVYVSSNSGCEVREGVNTVGLIRNSADEEEANPKYFLYKYTFFIMMDTSIGLHQNPFLIQVSSMALCYGYTAVIASMTTQSRLNVSTDGFTGDISEEYIQGDCCDSLVLSEHSDTSDDILKSR